MRKLMTDWLVVGVLIVGVVPCMFAQDKNFHIYVCFGQSNMEGYADIESRDQTVDGRFRILQSVNCSGKPKDTWRTATPPLSRCNTKLGPADYFGREMVKNLPSTIKIGIVHVAVAGCKIELFDKVNYAGYAAGEQQWMKDIIAQYGGNPYGRLVELAKLAQKDGVIKGILLHQGESNSGDQNWPGKVKTIYSNLLKDLNLTAATTPLLVGQLVDAGQGGQCSGHNSIIDKLPASIPTSYVISSSGCTDQADNLHFSAAGYRELGARYARKMLSLVTLTAIEQEETDVSNADKMTISQNPFQDELLLKQNGNFEYELMTVSGQLLETGAAVDEIKIGKQAPKGLHLVKVSQNNRTQIAKVLKE